MCRISEKDKQLFIDMLDKDKHSLHFLWDCTAGTISTVGSALFDNVEDDPLDFLRESGLIAEEDLPQFNVFSSRLEEAIISGINANSLSSNQTRIINSAAFLLISCGTTAERCSQFTGLSVRIPRKR